jgi:hypothetical protein
MNHLRRENGRIRNGIVPFIVDNPTDQQGGTGMSDAFRASAEHAAGYEGDPRHARGALIGFDWSRLKVPLLLVHHREDGCRATPYREAAALPGRFPLVSVSGGEPPESGPCDPLAPHGYFGREAKTVDAMAAWMLKRPFERDIR